MVNLERSKYILVFISNKLPSTYLFLSPRGAWTWRHGPPLGCAQDRGEGAGGGVREEGRRLGGRHEVVENLCLPVRSLKFNLIVPSLSDIVIDVSVVLNRSGPYQVVWSLIIG